MTFDIVGNLKYTLLLGDPVANDSIANFGTFGSNLYVLLSSIEKNPNQTL